MAVPQKKPVTAAKVAAPAKKPAPPPKAPVAEVEEEEEIDLSDIEDAPAAEESVEDEPAAEEVAEVEEEEEEVAPPPKKAPAAKTVAAKAPAAKAAPAKPAATKPAPKKPAPPPEEPEEEEVAAEPEAEEAAEEAPAPKKAPPKPAKITAGSWDEDPQSFTGLPRFKGKEGTRHYIRLRPWKDADGNWQTVPAKVQTHYVEATKARAACTGDDTCPACEDTDTWGPPKTAWVMPVVHIQDRTPEGVVPIHKLKAWSFGADKFRSIKNVILPEAMDAGKKITEVDIVVATQVEKTQKLNLSIAAKVCYTQADKDAWTAEVETFTKWLQSEFTRESIEREMARKGKGGGKRRGDSSRFKDDDDDDPFGDGAPVRGKKAPVKGADKSLDDLADELGDD